MSVMGERRKYFKREAKFFLRYNYIRQVFMTGFIILLTFGLNAIKANIISILRLEFSFYAMPLGMFFDLIIFIATMPMYAGIIYVNIKLLEGENLPISGIFHYFSSTESLLECYKFIIAMFARLAAFALPFLLVGAAYAHIIYNIFGDDISTVRLDIIMLCVSLVYILAFIICLVIFMRYFAALFIFIKNPCLSVRDIMGKSAKLMKGRKIEALSLILSFAFWLLLSHFLAGVLYVFFTVPYMILCYVSFMSYLLAEKGDDFLSPAGDYIDAAAKKSKQQKVAVGDIVPLDLSDSRTAAGKILEEETLQIVGIVDRDYEFQEN